MLTRDEVILQLAHKGRPSWHKGRTKSEETRATMRAAQQGKIVTEETKEKLRQLTQEKIHNSALCG